MGCGGAPLEGLAGNGGSTFAGSFGSDLGTACPPLEGLAGNDGSSLVGADIGGGSIFPGSGGSSLLVCLLGACLILVGLESKGDPSLMGGTGDGWSLDNFGGSSLLDCFGGKDGPPQLDLKGDDGGCSLIGTGNSSLDSGSSLLGSLNNFIPL